MRRIIFLLVLCAIVPLQGGYTIRNGKLTDADLAPSMGVQDHFSAGMAAIEKKRWKEAQKQLHIVTHNFPDSPFAQEGMYYLAIAYYQRHDYEFADKFFTEYLIDQRDLKHFEEAARYKLAIGDKFAKGARTRLFGMKSLPKVFASKKRGYIIYDEIVAMMPGHDVAAQALFNKGKLHQSERFYTEAVATFQQLIDSFPRNERIPEAYIAISEVYLEQAAREINNPDLLPLAEINLRRFQQHLPNHPKVAALEKRIGKIREHYAKGLYKMGQFYERTKHKEAAVLYYVTSIESYPETKVANKSRERLRQLEELLTALNVDIEKLL